MILARYRPTTCPVEDEAHLLPLPLRSDDGRRRVVGTLCGRSLDIDHLETMPPGQDHWCTPCFLAHVIGTPDTPGSSTTAIGNGTANTGSTADLDTVAGRLATGVAYQRLGWPITLRHREALLHLERDTDAVALIIPTPLSTEVADILTDRRCPPPVLTHPAMPTHRIIVAGERFGLPLTWPTEVYRITKTLLLPPTVTTRGPIHWIRPPVPNALKLCREIDVIAALRTALLTPPSPDTTRLD